jgi:hypothetical protein
MIGMGIFPQTPVRSRQNHMIIALFGAKAEQAESLSLSSAEGVNTCELRLAKCVHEWECERRLGRHCICAAHFCNAKGPYRLMSFFNSGNVRVLMTSLGSSQPRRA